MENSGTDGERSFTGRKKCPMLKTKEKPEEQNLKGLCWMCKQESSGQEFQRNSRGRVEE